MPMRRIQILLTDDLDKAVTRVAERLGISKSEYIRRSLRQYLDAIPDVHDDPIWRIVGISDAEPIEDINELAYGPRA